jgi:hypothetical protein
MNVSSYEPLMAELASLGIAYTEDVTTTLKTQLWLRDEVKQGEKRAAITPTTTKKLVEQGRVFCFYLMCINVLNKCVCVVFFWLGF